MNWNKILAFTMRILPLKTVLIAIMSFLWDKVEATDNKWDDTAWRILGFIFVELGWMTQEDLSEITGIPGADGVPGKAREGLA